MSRVRVPDGAPDGPLVKRSKTAASHAANMGSIPVRVTSYSSLAQLVEHAAVNRRVVGSSPTGGARADSVYAVCFFLFSGGNVRHEAMLVEYRSVKAMHASNARRMCLCRMQIDKKISICLFSAALLCGIMGSGKHRCVPRCEKDFPRCAVLPAVIA